MPLSEPLMTRCKFGPKGQTLFYLESKRSEFHTLKWTQKCRLQNVGHFVLASICLRFYMMTSSKGNIFRVIGHLRGEFTGPHWIPCIKPVTRSFDFFFDLRLNKRLSKQSWGWWFETLSRPLWCHNNDSHSFEYVTHQNVCRVWLTCWNIIWKVMKRNDAL